jgi:GTP-binding protein Era
MIKTTRCGYIALLGRPNAGKSTLLNALVGEKLAVVSRKPQTTRNRLLGVITQDQTQLVFLDTPGLHGINQATRQNLINVTMNKVAMSVASDADLIVYLLDVTRGWTDADAAYLSRIIAASTCKILIAASKLDSIKQKTAAENIQKIEAGIEALIAAPKIQDDGTKDDTSVALRSRFIGIIPQPLSAKRPDDVAALRELIADHLPKGPWLFDKEDLTDMSTNFLCSELIREQLFRQLGEEVPYGCAVKLRSLTDKGNVVVIEAQIVLSRKHHKPIVLGKSGARIKEIGTAARASLERHFDKKVFLDLVVTIAEDWIDDQKLLAELAHLTELQLPSLQ